MFCGTGWLDVVPRIERALREVGVDAIVVARDARRPLVEQLHDVDVALPSNAPFGPREFAAAKIVRLVQQPAVGFEAIDLASARDRGVPVCNAPGSNTASVAQAALLLILALARRFHEAQRKFANAVIGSPLGIELEGRTLGIVGMGRTGSRLADAARALGMNVVGIRSSDGHAGLLAMLEHCDVVSVHAPLTPATLRLFDDEAFAAMKPGAYLVNVSRGGLIDRAALERALATRRLAGVGLDVFWEEPWDPRDPFFARDDVVVLPHVAGSTEEAFDRVAHIVAKNIAAMLRGESLVHRVA